MSNRQLTQEIYREDCVGDSSGKHNYNVMSLDTNICNVSSQFFISDNNFYTVFSDFIANYPQFIQATNLFLDPKRYNLVTATVNLLSSYWAKHEFSVHYPLNISLYNGLAVSCPTVNQLDEKLISLAKTYLNANYPAKNYNLYNYVNVVFFLYNVPVNPYDANDLITKKFSPEFSFVTRHMYAEYIKQDIHLGNGKIFKFYNADNNNWIYLGSDTGETDVTKQPTFKQSTPPRISTTPPNDSGRSVVNLTITVDTLDFDLYYQTIHSGHYHMGVTDITLTINSGVTVGCDVSGGAALVVSGFTSGDTVTIINNGNIIGYGGVAGQGQSLGVPVSNVNNGQNGGDAILLAYPATIINNGIIAGGGGGGAGGRATFNNTDYIKTYRKFKRAVFIGGSGGGGGAGFVGGTNGIGGLGNNQHIPRTITSLFWTSVAGNKGSSGSNTVPGVGGTSRETYGIGGNGGSLGSDGVSTGVKDANGAQFPPLGGKSGAAIRGSGFIVDLKTNNSTVNDIRGPIVTG
jgi:hypothetical protein